MAYAVLGARALIEKEGLVQKLRERLSSHILDCYKLPLDLDLNLLPSLEEVKSHGRLLLLGQQGAGKTTFIQYLLNECVLGNILSDYVPIFINLKDFSETKPSKTLLEFISQSFFDNDIVTTQNCSLHRFISRNIHEVMIHGKVLILIDSLDEIKDENIFKTLKQISELADCFQETRFIISGQSSTWKRILKKYRNKATDYLLKEFLELSTESYINHLTHKIRNQIRSNIQDRCGTMRVLDMAKPIGLTDIYTNVNILEQITGRRRKEVSDLLKEANIDDFDRFGLGIITEKRVPGLEAVNKYARLMILGKPGAGKTTFLKYIAVQCNNGQVLYDRVPVFITLKDFAEAENKPNIIQYISQQLLRCGVTSSEISTLLKYGRILILFDGLDEVREEDSRRVIKQIQEFSENFSFSEKLNKDINKSSSQLSNSSTDASLKWLSRVYPENYYINYIIATCRIAAREYTFENFTEVEVADFDDEQICTFATNWFKDKSIRVENFIERIESSSRIKQLATNPLLLTLLCLAFEESGDFPVNRSELYKEGLDALLKKWDAKRGIQRVQFYKKLSVQRKEELLSKIALITFEKKDYFFKKKDTEQYITNFISNLPNANTDPNELQLDSEEVLRLIVAQHGLLLERAVGIYSFSHLTFHEYFTARELIFGKVLLTEAVRKLADYSIEKRWREVLLLAIEMLPNADSLLKMMKEKIDDLLVGSRKLQQFLTAMHKKSLLISSSYKKAAIRASYIAGITELDFGLTLSLVREKIFEKEDNDGFTLTNPLKLDQDLQDILSFAYRLNQCDIINDRKDSFRLNSQSFFSILSKLKLDCFEAKYALLFKNHIKKIPRLKKVSFFEEWWIVNGFAWIEEYEKIVDKYFVGNDYIFSNEHQRLLRQYYDSNQLLVECLNSDCYVTRSVREEIEETLLLPIAEIKKWDY